MSSAGLYKSIYEDFFLDEALVRKIVDVINAHAKKLEYPTVLTYRLYKSDGTFINFDNIEQVLQDDNSPKKKLNRFIIELYKKEDIDKPGTDEIVSVDFDKYHDTKIHYTIYERNRDWSFLLVDDLENQLSRIERGKFWAKIQKRHFQFIIYASISILLGFLFFSYVSHNFIATILDTTYSEETKLLVNQTKLLFSSFLSLFMIICLLIASPIYKIAESMGDSIFYWGDEISRFDRAKSIKSKIIWVIIAGFVVSVLAGLFINHFSMPT